MPSSYDGDLPATQDELRRTFRLVRLQILSPISLLVSAGTTIVCHTLLKPSLSDVSRAHPTLVTPLSSMLASYWLVVYALQIGFCVMLVLARSEQMKDTLMRGVGLRFAVANWLQAAWAVFWTMQFPWSFVAAEICILLNILVLASILLTLHLHPSARSWTAALLVHAPMRLFLAVLLLVDVLDGGFIVLGWEARDLADYARHEWAAVGAVAGVNLAGLVWVFLTRDAVWALAAPYLLFSLLLKRPKPTALVVLLIALVVLHPLAWFAGVLLARVRSREGRIRLEEEALAGGEEAQLEREEQDGRQRARMDARSPADGAEAA